MPTDSQVLRNIIDAFEQISGLQSPRLNIDVRSRVVTIRGRVHSDVERQQVERVARGIVGLRALVLEVGVARKSNITRRVLEKLPIEAETPITALAVV
jgi:osmotically-inducible protein OsmY